MQAKKVALRRPSEAEIRWIAEFLEALGAKGLVNLGALWLLEIEGGSYNDCFEVNGKLLEIVQHMNRSPYSLGFYVGSIHRRKGFKPSLPLAMRACRLCRVGLIDCYRLGPREALRFTYGRCVPLSREGYGGGARVRPVVHANYCLGWGAPVRRGSVKYLCPLVDLGWYLRRGG